MKLWDSGKKGDKSVEEYTVGNDYTLDMNLVPFDCKSSIAHAKMLAKIGILKPAEAIKLEKELLAIIKLHSQGKFTIKREQEDCHTAIENHLTAKLGDLGKKIHTARSRNDQVLTALRLYYRSELERMKGLTYSFIEVLEDFRKKNGNIAIPGYTHMRKAMPSSIEMWSHGFIESAYDNLALLNSALELSNQSPLGTAAGYGVPIQIDREMTAKELGFSRIQKSPIYAQLSRGKFEQYIATVLSMQMHDLNRMSSDLILFSMPEFGYYELPQAYTTGSSIMPQKRNPDVLELVRGNYHRIMARGFELGSLGSNLPTGYNRDMQLSKQAIMECFDISSSSISIMTDLISDLKVNKAACEKAMTSELFATQEALNLVKKGVPFRDAYKKIAKKY
jgi:argininosuccinate lyase